MEDTEKYLIHADVTVDGVVERNDVVGAVFGQTEGLLGDELDLRSLQEGSKVGRIDVEIDSRGGQSFGHMTIASGLDRVETAVLAAGLETVERIGPCRSTIEVTDIEDVRGAKRRKIVERATQLLAEYEADALSSRDLVERVREQVRVEDVTDYRGYPAGPRVADSDAVIVVEGRADVVRLLRFGVKNAVAVEGTDVPETVAALTRDRTVTAFLDGDRGGELILEELAQVGNVDYVAFAPEGRSVEDLSREEILAGLREKVPYHAVVDAGGPREVRPRAAPEEESVGETDGGALAGGGSTDERGADASAPEAAAQGAGGATVADPGVVDADDGADVDGSGGAVAEDAAEGTTADEAPATVAEHVAATIRSGSGEVRLLDADAAVLATGPAVDAFDLVEAADPAPATVVLDGTVEQRLLDVAAQRGVGQVIGADAGEFVKRPVDVRVRTADEFPA